MTGRIRGRLQFLLERIVVRGPLHRLLIVAGLIGVVSLVAGTLVYAMGGIGSFGAAVWWAFLRLSDPGYLGDDTGLVMRSVSTVVTVLGYVLFLGALVAIMIQWFNVRMRALERGLTPIAQNGHVVVLGWTNRTAAIVDELMRSDERVRTFLRRRGARRLHVVLLSEDVDPQRVQDLRDHLGDEWDSRRITFRSGSPLRLEHLKRVDFSHAAAILLPSVDFGEGGADAADTRAIKTLLSIANSAPQDEDERFPLLVAEMFDSRKVEIAYGAYRGPMEIVASDSVIARLIAQNVRHPGLSYVFAETLHHGEGNEFYVPEGSDLVGQRILSLFELFPEAIPLGIVRPDGDGFRILLDPTEDPVVAEDDRIVLLAPGHSATRARAAQPDPASADLRPPGEMPRARRERHLLVIGWSHRVPALLRELGQYEQERFSVDVLSMVPPSERAATLEHYELAVGQVTLRHLELDCTVPVDVARLDLERYDNVVLIASDWLETGEESDARTIVAHLLLEQRLRTLRRRPSVLVELTDGDNVRLFDGRESEVLVSPLIVSHMLAQVTLRRELHPVFDELFGSAGAEILFRPASSYGFEGRPVGFVDVQRAAAVRGEVALGVRRRSDRVHPGGVLLNPSRDESWPLADADDVVVLTSY